MGGVIEEAASGRAKCRVCQEKIPKGELRFGEKVPNPFAEGEATYWFHLPCAADYRPEPLLEALEQTEQHIEARAELIAVARQGIERPKLSSIGRAERAPSGRARCRQCRELIEKEDYRLVVERIEDGMLSPGGFIHARCAVARAGPDGLVERVRRRTKGLTEEELESVVELIASGSAAPPNESD